MREYILKSKILSPLYPSHPVSFPLCQSLTFLVSYVFSMYIEIPMYILYIYIYVCVCAFSHIFTCMCSLLVSVTQMVTYYNIILYLFFPPI